LINVEGIEELYNNSLQNTKEAQLVMQIVTKVLAKAYCSLNEIGLVTCYKGQKRLLERAMELATNKYPSIFGAEIVLDNGAFTDYGYTDNRISHGVDQENSNKENLCCIELIDGEKPMDKDMIIFSTVRSNNDGKLGELNDPRILNSILTKSRQGVIIVGNLRTLINNSAWRDFILWSQVEGLILNYN